MTGRREERSGGDRIFSRTSSLSAAGAALILFGTSAAGAVLVDSAVARGPLAFGAAIGALVAGWAGRRFLREARAHARAGVARREES
ncbi:MAG: hypothetical protein ACRDHK_16075, partial [Actinomycetota bacterium]